MLSDKQKNFLKQVDPNENKDDLGQIPEEDVLGSPQKKAEATYRLSKKLEIELRDLQAANMLLEKLPRDACKRVVTWKDLIEACRLTEYLLDILDVHPVQYDEDTGKQVVAKSMRVKPRGEAKTAYIIQYEPATEEDDAIAHYLDGHIKRLLNKFLRPDLGLMSTMNLDTYQYELRREGLFKGLIDTATKEGYEPATKLKK